MSDAKQQVMRIVEQMTDEKTLEEIVHHLYAYATVQRGLAEIEAGQGIPHDQVKREIQEWLASPGPRPPFPNFEEFTAGSPATL